ncbi:MAG: PQQ-binding-like beta-propeller repeat protein [Pirellulales bacterium]|nr:PQQ-binding-like beta-propeller repeat protein [Pirellulales bacterium]
MPILRACLSFLLVLSGLSPLFAQVTAKNLGVAASAPQGKAAPAPLSVAAVNASVSSPADWPNWRGPDQDGVSRSSSNLVSTVDLRSGKNVAWKNEEAGGISTPIIYKGKLYTIVRDARETNREMEKVICLDAATGNKIWEAKHNVYLSDVPAERVGWSCCVADPQTNTIFAQGVNGYFACLDADTGKVVWDRSLHEEFGALSTYGGRTNVPVVFDDMVIASAVVIGWGEMARPAHRFLGMDKHTGEVRWFNGTKELPEDTTYSTPVIKVIDGQAQMIFGSSDGSVWSFQPRTGVPLWNYKLSRRGISVSPLVVGDTVYIAQGEENMDNTTIGCVAAINAKGAKGDITDKKEHLLWMQKSVMCGKSSPVIHNDRLYCVDDSSNLFILDAKTGQTITKRPIKLVGALTRASPLVADDKIYMPTTSGLHILQPTAEGAKFLLKARLDPVDEVSGSMIASENRVYLPTNHALYCFADGDPAASASPPPITSSPEPPVSGSDTPSHVQVVPCEVLMQPGEAQKFSVRLFNARGQLLGEQSATFTLAGPGEITPEGNFTADKSAAHVATVLTAKVGNLTGTARIRVVPPLPWKFDFNSIPLAEVTNPVTKAKSIEGEPVITWVGVRHRHKIREIDGEKVMVKVTTIPRGTRSQGWLGPWNMTNYTIQADLRGQAVKAIAETDQGKQEIIKLPDMGLINMRYTLDMMGDSQKLQLRSWTSQIKTRFSKDLPFAWEGGKWYTMKFSAHAEDGKAILRGKVWERGQPEPQEWQIEAVDETPNVVGSPGLFGNASVAEIYIDNLQVYPNPPTTVSQN